MQYGLLIVMGSALGMTMRRIVFWRHCGYMNSARRLYQRAAWVLGGTAYIAMAVQEVVLMMCGKLTWSTGLPLHLCSMMGLLVLPMLLTGHRLLWHWSLYLGLPGALMAIIFPSILSTPWPEVTALAFHTLHCSVALAPLLPLALGQRPSPGGALSSMAFLLIFACVALGINTLTGSNYLFLNLPVADTPLSSMARGGLMLYRAILTLVCAAVLAVEAALVHWWQSRS